MSVTLNEFKEVCSLIAQIDTLTWDKGTNIAGEKFGDFTALCRLTARNGHRPWLCICDCGNIRTITGGHLRNGWRRNCAHRQYDGQRAARARTLNGKRFGRWTVLGHAGVKDAGTRGAKSLWNCVCECGTSAVVFGTSLIQGNSRSCGCIQAKYEGTTRERQRMSEKHSIDRISDHYVRVLLKHLGIVNPPPQLIAAKRDHLRFKRLIKEKRNAKADCSAG